MIRHKYYLYRINNHGMSSDNGSTTDVESNTGSDSVDEHVFDGYNTNNIKDIIDVVDEINTDAAVTISEVFSKKNELEKRVAKLESDLHNLQNEFDNYKQRKSNETEELKETASAELLRDALPIRDNIMRALDQDEGEIIDGIEMVKDDFDRLLESKGVEIIKPQKGDSVDPKIHEVMTKVSDEDVAENNIVECYRPGYIIENELIRPARVSVSS